MTATATATARPPASRGRPALSGALDRLVVPMPTDRLTGWLGPLAITVVAGFLRLWQITQPRGIYFDEVYYTKDAYSLLTKGYELNKECNGPAFVVHPPLGKWMIAVSEWMWGYVDCGGVRHGDPELGWRFSCAIAGTLSVLVIARTARRMFRSTVLGCFAGLLLAFDGLEFVQSRIGILDIFLMMWLVFALGCLVRDRDWGREKLAAALRPHGDEGGLPAAAGDGGGASGVGVALMPAAWTGDTARIGWRPWRIACGVCLGAALGTKWSALYTVVAFTALALAWDVGARRTAGATRPFTTFLRRDLRSLAAGFVVVPVVIYAATWTGWFMTSGGYDRHLYGSGVIATLHGWWKYHDEMKQFHEHLSTPHPFASKPMSWLVLGRPVAYYYSGPKLGQNGCHTTAGCSREVLALGNPAIWWVGTLALAAVAALWVARRDWRAALILVGFGGSFLPWLAFPSRTMFFFYALPLLPFLVLGLTAVAGVVLGPRTATDSRRLAGALIVGVYATAVTLLFVYFYPILAAQTIPTTGWRARMWFPGWI